MSLKDRISILKMVVAATVILSVVEYFTGYWQIYSRHIFCIGAAVVVLSVIINYAPKFNDKKVLVNILAGTSLTFAVNALYNTMPFMIEHLPEEDDLLLTICFFLIVMFQLLVSLGAVVLYIKVFCEKFNFDD